ncbi:Alanine--tRNA ligase [Gossypium arboreum]|uniref:Alanine--tRNA ligase n=1 Tax=Gossypium arboreum TaxID=29729 RepID=A0A0B0N7E9_GOSAR|nr:Alanine--tRNA ligase [Gossypium arboreum]KHG14322.1 Alanine--tRNA ligase [Gossypium arboreum]KHG21148.1 Alanine--tRNA ligase [Gossypium arboreum]KHG30249.1 Alanine--tRNA ligase [Gossypium arboreum]
MRLGTRPYRIYTIIPRTFRSNLVPIHTSTFHILHNKIIEAFLHINSFSSTTIQFQSSHRFKAYQIQPQA